jgi:hypothetical protein
MKSAHVAGGRVPWDLTHNVAPRRRPTVRANNHAPFKPDRHDGGLSDQRRHHNVFDDVSGRHSTPCRRQSLL